jgi:hypothetical protein
MRCKTSSVSEPVSSAEYAIEEPNGHRIDQRDDPVYGKGLGAFR